MSFPESVEQFIEELDKTFENTQSDSAKTFERIKEGFKKYDNDQNNVELLWRAGKAAYKAAAFAESKGDSKSRKEFLLEGEKYVDKALAVNPESGDAHEWKAYICGKISTLLSVKEKIQKGKEMEKHLEEAMKLKPNSRDVFFAHGRWAMEVSSLSWIERKVANTLFGSVPETSFEEAIKSFERSKEIKSDSRSNLYYCGKCKVQLKKYKEAIIDFDNAAKCPFTDEEDKIIDKDLLAMQSKYASYRA